MCLCVCVGVRVRVCCTSVLGVGVLAGVHRMPLQGVNMFKFTVHLY